MVGSPPCSGEGEDRQVPVTCPKCHGVPEFHGSPWHEADPFDPFPYMFKEIFHD